MKTRKFLALLAFCAVAGVLVGNLVHERNLYRTRTYVLEAMFMYGCIKAGDSEASCVEQLGNFYTTMAKS